MLVVLFEKFGAADPFVLALRPPQRGPWTAQTPPGYLEKNQPAAQSFDHQV